MPPSITTEKITLTYPVFAADFLDQDRLLVAGGGGEGRSGVGNKITLLDVSKSSNTSSNTSTHIKTLSEHELRKDEDACMTLAVSHPSAPSESPNVSRKKKRKSIGGGAVIFAGINSSEASQRAGKNEHLRTFRITDGDEISLTSQRQLFSVTNTVETYQRVLRTRGQLVALASGGGLSASSSSFEIVVSSTADISVRRRISTPVETADLDLADDGTLAFCSSKEIFLTPATLTTEPKKLPFTPIPGTLRSIRFLNPSRLLAVINYPQRSGATLLLLDTATGTTLARLVLPARMKAVTGLDAVALTPESAIIALAGADQSIHLYTVSGTRIKRAQHFPSVHPFQISKVAFSQPSRDIVRLASTSIGNTVVVFTLPLMDGKKLLPKNWVAKQTAVSVVFSLLAVVVFAVLLQTLFVKRAGLPWWGEDGLLRGMEMGAGSDVFDAYEPPEVVEKRESPVVAGDGDTVVMSADTDKEEPVVDVHMTDDVKRDSV